MKDLFRARIHDVARRPLAALAFVSLLGCNGRSLSNDDDSAAAGDGSGATGGNSGGTAGQGGTLGSGGPSGQGGGAGGEPSGGGAPTRGACGQLSTATVTQTEYEGFEEYYVAAEEPPIAEPFDDFLCLIRVEVKRVGEAPPGCRDVDQGVCTWSHLVELSNPEVVTNVDDACSTVELPWLRELDGSRVAYGYVEMYQGHDSVVMKYVEPRDPNGTGTWVPFGRAYWDETSGEFAYDVRLGACEY